MPVFKGGPLDGQIGYGPGVDPPVEELFGPGGPPPSGGLPPGGSPEGGDDLPPTARFDRIIRDVRALLTVDGEWSQQDKLKISKVESFLQELLAGREREEEQALQGKLSPGVMKRAYQAGSGGPL